MREEVKLLSYINRTSNFDTSSGIYISLAFKYRLGRAIFIYYYSHMGKMFEKVKQFVQESFGGSVTDQSMDHFERTLYWARQLRPDADEAILIAAYAHDIARAFRSTNSEQTFKNRELNDPKIMEEHQREGARIMMEFLVKEGFEKEKIERVANMISKHEFGGDEESDLIKDADSISYLEVNAPKHAKKLAGLLGKEKIERKICWMFERITSERARQMTEPFYKNAIDILKSS